MFEMVKTEESGPLAQLVAQIAEKSAKKILSDIGSHVTKA